MESVSGVVDLSVEQQADVPTIKVQFLRPAMAQYGLTIHEIARHLEAAIRGVEVSRILEGQSTYDLVVRLTESKQWEWERMGELMIDTPSGVKVPLKTVASLRKTTGPNTISREQVERKIVVQCNVSDRDVTSVVQDCQKLVNPIIMAKATTELNTVDSLKALPKQAGF
jgi:Cu/Ag efflux pump CusA